MAVNRTTSLITGTVATIAGLVVSFFVVKGMGDLLFPEVPGFSLEHAFLFVLAALLMAGFLFVEAYRLFKAAANCKREH
jgi:hypothetical protein